jgi:hypothetical protein
MKTLYEKMRENRPKLEHARLMKDSPRVDVTMLTDHYPGGPKREIRFKNVPLRSFDLYQDSLKQ